MNRSKSLLTLTTAGLLVTAIAVQASSPEAWEQHYQEVRTSCLNVSGLNNAEPVGEIITFSDDVGYDALLVSGTYPQPDLNNQAGQVLCLFNRQTRQAIVSEADGLQQPVSDHLSGVPGQPIGQVIQWANNHSFLPPLQPVEQLEEDYPGYQSVVNLGQRPGQSAAYITFEVFTDTNGYVTSQTIDYRDPSSIRRPLMFTQTDSEGLQLIETIYGEQIKDDFVRSIRSENADSNESSSFTVNHYSGELFDYQTWNDGSSAQFTVVRLGD
ncbi:hypothetical protein H6F88_00260 [Oculatella sp. FACHB-28]|uniref:hypothetical protein n=1 Tax=Oculatella sp. FACHB-28 TaxID=2692845 RepID=UPI001688A61A|nr:hypothetical protein [Oculatella sp. FACHB-28]MBD2054482.1 hypothetical protein [Oculatella sp. FACHB-28]